VRIVQYSITLHVTVRSTWEQVSQLSKEMKAKEQNKSEAEAAGQDSGLDKPGLGELKGAVQKTCFLLGSAVIIIICLRNSLTWHIAR